MRVASRRLRAVLEIFAPCFPQGDYKTVLRDVKALADALGERRDPDVHIEAMEAFERDVQATNRPGIDALVARLRQRQARGNDALAARAGGRPRERAAGAPALARATARWRSSNEGPQRQGPRPRGHARRQRRADRAGAARRAVLVHAQGDRPGRGRRAARHADRRQAPALRARGHRTVLRPLRGERRQARQGPPGPARRDPRLRRPAPRGGRVPARADGGGRGRRRRVAEGSREGAEPAHLCWSRGAPGASARPPARAVRAVPRAVARLRT